MKSLKKQNTVSEGIPSTSPKFYALNTIKMAILLTPDQNIKKNKIFVFDKFKEVFPHAEADLFERKYNLAKDDYQSAITLQMMGILYLEEMRRRYALLSENEKIDAQETVDKKYQNRPSIQDALSSQSAEERLKKLSGIQKENFGFLNERPKDSRYWREFFTKNPIKAAAFYLKANIWVLLVFLGILSLFSPMGMITGPLMAFTWLGIGPGIVTALSYLSYGLSYVFIPALQLGAALQQFASLILSIPVVGPFIVSAAQFLFDYTVGLLAKGIAWIMFQIPVLGDLFLGPLFSGIAGMSMHSMFVIGLSMYFANRFVDWGVSILRGISWFFPGSLKEGSLYERLTGFQEDYRLRAACNSGKSVLKDKFSKAKENQYDIDLCEWTLDEKGQRVANRTQRQQERTGLWEGFKQTIKQPLDGDGRFDFSWGDKLSLFETRAEIDARNQRLDQEAQGAGKLGKFWVGCKRVYYFLLKGRDEKYWKYNPFNILRGIVYAINLFFAKASKFVAGFLYRCAAFCWMGNLNYKNNTREDWWPPEGKLKRAALFVPRLVQLIGGALYRGLRWVGRGIAKTWPYSTQSKGYENYAAIDKAANAAIGAAVGVGDSYRLRGQDHEEAADLDQTGRARHGAEAASQEKNLTGAIERTLVDLEKSSSGQGVPSTYQSPFEMSPQLRPKGYKGAEKDCGKNPPATYARMGAQSFSVSEASSDNDWSRRFDRIGSIPKEDLDKIDGADMVSNPLLPSSSSSRSSSARPFDSSNSSKH